MLTHQESSCGDTIVTLQVPPDFLRTLKRHPANSDTQPTLDPSTITKLSDLGSYWCYAPTSSTRFNSNKHFFGRLGFKSGDQSEDMRQALVDNMDGHVQHTSHRFLLKIENPQALKVVVLEFLAEYGPVYWGNSERDHLKEPNILKGFLCPRDATRPDSRLVAVLESFFNYRAYNARRVDAKKPLAIRLNRGINFAALTGRKADLTPPLRVVEQADYERHWRKRRRVLSDNEEPTQPTQTRDNDQTGVYGKTALPMDLSSHRSALPGIRTVVPIASAEPGRSQNPTSTLDPLPGAIRSDLCPIIIKDDSDTGEEQWRKNTKTHASSNLTTNPNSSTGDKFTRIKDEALSPEITSRIKLRVRASGPGVSARGPVVIDFEVYKTSEQLFTSLMAERNLEPEMMKKVSELTASINGKETCCRRGRLDDWIEVCTELGDLWEKSPTLFNKRFEVDVMLHVGAIGSTSL